MVGCATSNQVPPSYTLLETQSAIPLYGVNSVNAPKDYKIISQVSMTGPAGPYQEEFVYEPQSKHPRFGYSIRAKAILAGANAVVNVRKKIMEIPVEDEFGKRRQRVIVTSGDAVFDPSSKKRFITPKLIELFNRKTGWAGSRDELGNMIGWRFFLTPNGDVVCERGAVGWKAERILIRSDQLKSYAN
jgi:hypothetical protein